MKLARITFALLLVSLMAGAAMAQPGGQRRGGGRGPGDRGMFSPLERLSEAIKKLDLTSDQKEKFEALKKEYEPKFKALREKSEGILTEDQKKAQADAIKAARSASPEERRDAWKKIGDAVKLTDDQKEKMEKARTDSRALFEEIRGKASEILTDEQKEKLKSALESRGGRGRGGRGPDSGAANPKAKQST